MAIRSCGNPGAGSAHPVRGRKGVPLHRATVQTVLVLWSLAFLLPSFAEAADALYSVATRGASAAAVGEGGRILRAYPAPHNGNWIPSLGSPVAVALRAVSIGATDYFAVGDEGSILQSTDPAGQGITWQQNYSGTTLQLSGIARGLGRIAAVGDSGAVFLSTNLEGGLWQRVDTLNVATRKHLRAAAGNTSFVVAVGDSGTILWTQGSTMTRWSKAVAVPTQRDLFGVASEPAGTISPRYWAVGQAGTILVSGTSPAAAWSAQVSPSGVDLHGVAIYRLLPDNVLISVAVGRGGTILRSADSQTWTQVDSGTDRDLFAVAYTGSGSGGGFVAVGDENTILWSPTGLSWSPVVVPTERTTWGRIRGAWRSQEPGR